MTTSVLEKLNIELKNCNFEFMKLDIDLADSYRIAYQAEFDFALGAYDNSLVNVRKVTENLADLIIDMNYEVMNDRATFNDKLTKIKGYIDSQKIIDIFYKLKNSGNLGAHGNENDSQKAYEALQFLRLILIWYVKFHRKIIIQRIPFVKPEVVNRFKNNQERKLIYIQTADNSSGKWSVYDGAEKIGETTAPEEDLEEDWSPNSDFLRSATEKRLKGYMTTAGVPYKIDWSELAWIKSSKSWFGDKAVHEVLTRSGYKHHEDLEGTEWFKVDLETVKEAIKAVKEGRSSLKLTKKEATPKIVLRAEQEAAVSQAIKAFKKHPKVLWNAKMRFGKTLSTYDLIKKNGYQKVLVMTHRPVVSESWFEDFEKSEMANLGYEFGSKGSGEKNLEKLLSSGKPFIYFASIQDLRGAEKVGGKFDKNNEFFETDWSLVVVDEAHEGTQTELGDNLYEELTKKNTKILELSGTPFNILDEFSEEQVFTWDYIMEQQAKIRFSVEHPDKVNPYETLPEVEMYTFKMEAEKQFQNSEKYFDFAEFFKTDESGKFIHEASIKHWLNQISKDDGKSCYPFSTKDYRESIRHTLWLLPSRSSVKALKVLLEQHPVFREYTILNIVDNNDDEIKGENDADMDRVRGAITDSPSKTKTIILTVRKLTTGVNIKPLNGVVFLNNTTSAQNYLQAAFRAQTPFSDEVLGIKKKAFIFDFAPDRALNILAKSVSMSPKAGILNTKDQEAKLRTLLNFLPILEQSGHTMKPYSVNNLMRQLKKAFAEKAVLSGFDDASIYNDELWGISQEDATLFNELYAKLGKTQQTKKTNKVDVNSNGLDDKKREQAKRGKRKSLKERTEEEKEAIETEQKAKKERNNMIAILRGISIRIPLMIYGMDMDLEKDIKLDDFVNLVDDVSWEEFMPKGITKKDFVNFKRFYDPDVFIEAGHRIRQASVSANKLSYQDRIEKITTIFSGFKNPDKETVLTPWRVVNMQLGTTLGGFNFFDEKFKDPLNDGKYREINLEKTTNEVFLKNAKVLELNSKTGLYPLYMAFSIYQRRFIEESGSWQKSDFVERDKSLWNEVLEKNIFVLNKTPMARMITYRTLNGYEKNEKALRNLVYIKDLTDKLREDMNSVALDIEKIFGDEIMKFDVIVGNPPYHESDGGANASARPVYQLFSQLAIEKLNATKVSLITPSKWFAGGKGLNDYRSFMLNNSHIQTLSDYVNSKDVFSGVSIGGGVSFFLYNRNFDGDCNVINHYNGVEKSMIRSLSEYPVFVRYNDAVSLLHKVTSKSVDFISSYVRPRNPFGLSSKQRGESKEFSDSVLLLTSVGEYYVDRKFIKIGTDMIDQYKVVISKVTAEHAGEPDKSGFFKIVSSNRVMAPKSVCTDSYLVVYKSESKTEAENYLLYLKSKFYRTLLMLSVTSINLSIDKFQFIPNQDFTSKSDIDWAKSVIEIDQQLYKKYGLSKSEISFIEEKVKPMD